MDIQLFGVDSERLTHENNKQHNFTFFSASGCPFFLEAKYVLHLHLQGL